MSAGDAVGALPFVVPFVGLHRAGQRFVPLPGDITKGTAA